ncbi:MAG: tetratricopeptide repeat protein, partial [Alphaproteobacteria bacterium]|nr:tetratricopeptide repeat protein [Alphaproteobacteria bacterium]
MGKANYFLKKDDQANNYFNQVLSRYPLHKRALEIGYFQSKILYNNEQWTACIENCLVFKDKFANEDLGKVEILMALTYLKLNDRERAYSILNNVSGQYKNLAKIELSKIYLMENQLKAASKAISTIYGELNEPLKAEVTYLKGKIAFINRSWFEAKSLFNGYLKTYSKSLKIAEVRFLLAFIPFEQKNYEEAIKSLGSYKLSSTNAFYITQADYFIARSYEESGQIVLALSQYEELVRQGFKSEYYSEALLRLYKVFKTKQNQEKVEYYLNLLANSSQEDIKRFALKEMVLKHLSSDLEESRTFFAKLTPNSKDKIWYIKELLKAEQITEALKHLNAFGSKPEDLLESEWEELIFLKSETLFNNQQYA